MLQIPVVVQAKTRDGKDVRENTQTVVVNAHGGLLKLKIAQVENGSENWPADPANQRAS